MASLHLSPLDLVDSHPSQHSHRPFSTLDQAALEAAVGLTPSANSPSFLPTPDQQLHDLAPSDFTPPPALIPDHFHSPDPNYNPLAQLQRPRPPPPAHQFHNEHHLNPAHHHLPNPNIWSLPATACTPSSTVDPPPALPGILSDDALSPLTKSMAPHPVSSDNPSTSTMSAAPSSPPARGESAVDRAKRAAEDFTQAQLAKKRRPSSADSQAAKRRKSSSCSDDDDHDDDNRPEKVSHRKYQKRLQKNRDSAFVSRIRRREYTKVLEESLLKVESEKDAAVRRFLEMKQRFEVASAELSGIKQAAIAIAPFSGPQPVAEEPQQPQQGAARSGTVATMFMFAFMFGALLPEGLMSKGGDGIGVARGRFDFLSNLGSRGPKGAEIHLPNVFNDKSGTSGNVWRMPRQGRPEDYQVLPPGQRLLATVRADAERLLDGKAEAFVEDVERYLNKLRDDEVEGLNTQLQQFCTKGDVGAARLRDLARRIRESNHVGDDELRTVIGALGGLAVANEP